MGLRVIDSETQVSNGRGRICIESDQTNFPSAIAELQNAKTRNFAIAEMTKKGMADPRVEFPESPYPVDPEGNLIERPKEQKIHRYRISIPVTQRMA